jgi:hypothetical protein
VGHRRTRHGIGICIAGTGLALAPLSAASADKHPPAHNASPAAVCAAAKKEQQSSSSVGLSIEKAIASGDFAAARREMLNAYNTDLANVQKVQGFLKSAPADVQAAFKDLVGFVRQIRTDIQEADSEQQLVVSFESMGDNPKLATDGTTIQTWFASKCGGAGATPTSSSSP